MINYKPRLGQMTEDKYAEEGNASEEPDEKSKDNSEKQSQVKAQGFSLYLSMHFLYYTGFYRLLPSKDFPIEISLGYALDLFLGVLPMLFIEIFNNSLSPGKLAGLQSIIIIFKLLSLLNFTIEIIVMIWEIRLNYKMRGLNIKGFEKCTEEDRRRTYGRKYTVCGIVSFVLYIVILGLCIFGVVESRSCTDKHALELGVCVPC